jgi:hypothetical protein
VLAGEAGGSFCFGTNRQAEATVGVDVLAYNLLASGRLFAKAVLARATIEGDLGVATWFPNQTDVPY